MNDELMTALPIIALLCAGCVLSGAERILNSFEDDAELTHFEQGDSGTVKLAIGAPTTTGNERMLAITFLDGRWPGIHRKNVPTDWTEYEVLRFNIYSRTDYSFSVRIDDSNSTNHSTRYGKSFKLSPGMNLCQIETKDIARVLKLDDIKALIFFTSDPPAGLTLYMDDLVLGSKLSEQVPFIPYSERKDLQPTLRVVTPHLPFAKGLAGGPLKTFCLTSVLYGRETSEMMQRADMTVSQLTWDRSFGTNTWGFGDFYGQRGHMFDNVLMGRYIASSMQGPESFDAMYLSTPQCWELFPLGAREAIFKRVSEKGEGLVFVQPFPGGGQGVQWPDDLRSVNALIDCETDYKDNVNGYIRAGAGSALGQKWRIVNDHPILRGIPLDAIPTEAIRIQPYKVADGATVLIETEKGLPVLAIREVGKGRVVTCAWRTQGLTPEINNHDGIASAYPYRYWEPIYSLMIRSGLWAAGRDFDRTGEPESLILPNENADDALAVNVWRNADGSVTDWELLFTPPAENPVKTIDVIAPETVIVGEPVSFTFDAKMLESNADSAMVRIALIERAKGRRRTLEASTIALKSLPKNAEGASEFTLSSRRVRQTIAIIEVDIFNTTNRLAKGQADVVVEPIYQPGESRWQDFEVLMWPVHGLPFLASLEDNMMRDWGSTGVMITGWRSRDFRMRWARAGLRIMVHDFARRQLQLSHEGFALLSDKWNKTRDRNLLIRQPSYADPEFLKAEVTRVGDVVKMLKPLNPTNWITCDEPSISSYAKDFDFDFHPENIAWFRRALAEKFQTVANLNKALNTTFESFDAVYPPMADEAKASKTWGLWNEWRAHNDYVMAEGYRHYRDIVTALDPNGTISISGTQRATPFDGFDWSRLSALFGTMQGYGYGHQDRKRLSFNPEMLNAVPAGYGRSGRSVDHQIWSSLVQNGAGHVLFWWIAFRNPDLSYCQSAKDYSRIFDEIKRGIGKQYQQATILRHPIAIIYSMNSMRASYSLGDMEGSSGTWFQVNDKVTDDIIAAGFDPFYISDDQVASGELTKRGVKYLFLPMTLSVGAGDKPGGLALLPALKSFVKAGGKIVYTHSPSFDEFLQPATIDAGTLSTWIKYDSIEKNLTPTLESAGVKRFVIASRPDGSPVPKLTVPVHQLKGSTGGMLVTVIRAPAGTKEVVGGDGVVHVVPDPDAGNEIETVALDLSALDFKTAYDIRSGKRLELTDKKYKFDMLHGDGFPIALLPYDISELRLGASASDRMLTIDWNLIGSERYAPHVVRVSIGDFTEGGASLQTEDAALSFNATTNDAGRGSATIPLALEDAGRTFVITVKDILTGKTATVIVSPSQPE